MRVLTRAVRTLQVLNPEYFVPGKPRLKGTPFRMPRPPLLSQEAYAGIPLNHIVAPQFMAAAPVALWFDRFNEVATEYLYATASEINVLTIDMAARARLNRKQLSFLLPPSQAKMAYGPSLLMAFCLYGAVVSGAALVELTPDTFVVEHEGQQWGVRAHHPLSVPEELAPLFNYRNYITGAVKWQANCRHGNLVRAFKEARRAEDTAAMYVLMAAFWNTPDSWALDSLFTIGAQGE